MTVPLCPSEQQLLAFVAGQLSDAVAETVAAHLDACTHCEAKAGAIEQQGDPFLVALARPAGGDGAGTGDFTTDPQYVNAAAAVAAWGGLPPSDARDSGRATHDGGQPAVLGQYRLLERLGAGGMGAVYKALHTRLDKIVAIKLLPRDRLQDEAAVARFNREMKAVGRLEHPHIVRAMDAGDAGGTHFLVMEHVPGIDLAEVVQRLGPLAIPDACELVRQAALGLEHVHEYGLVHRDIKPSNLMLTRAPGVAGHPDAAVGGAPPAIVKILDLGLALLAGPQAATEGELTGSGQLMGTLDYMAPEQGTNSHDVDIRADVYALGATLYKLLSGEAPFGGGRYDTPVKKMIALATESPASLTQRTPGAPRELADLVDAMLAKDPAQRPSTPAVVTQRLARFCAGSDLGQVLERAAASRRAGPPRNPPKASTRSAVASSQRDTTIERQPVAAAERRRTRWRWLVAAGLAALILGAALISIRTPHGTILVEIPDGPAKAQVRVAVRGPQREVVVADHENRWTVQVRPGQYEVALTSGSDQFEIDDGSLSVTRNEEVIVRIRRKPLEPPPAAVSTAPPPDGPAEPEPAQPPVEAGPPPAPTRLTAAVSFRAAITGHTDWFGGVALSHDAAQLFDAGQVESLIRVYDTTTCQLVKQLKGHARPVHHMTFSPDGTLMASSACGEEIRLWSATASEPIATLRGHLQCTPCVAFSPDGQTLASCSLDSTVKLWDVESGTVKKTLRGDFVQSDAVTFSPDGQYLAAASRGGKILIWDAATTEPLRVIPPGNEFVFALAFARDSRTLASASTREGVIRLWDPATGEPRGRIDFPARGCRKLAYSTDGRILVAGDRSGRVRIWHAETHELLAVVPAHAEEIEGLALSADGKLLATASRDGLAKLWDLRVEDVPIGPEGELRRLAGHGSRVTALAFSWDSQQLLSAADDRTLRLWNLAAGGQFCQLATPAVNVECVALSSDGGLAVSGDEQGATLWDLSQGQPLRRLETQKFVQSAAFARYDELVAVGGLEQIRVFRVATGERLHEFTSREGSKRYSSLVFLPDGQSLLSFSLVGVASPNPEGIVHHWRLGQSEPLRATRLQGFRGGVQQACFAPDGRLVAVPASDTSIGVWNAETGQPVRLIEEFADRVHSVAFSAGGRYLAAGSRDHQLRVWDLRDGALVCQFTADSSCTTRLAFAPSGQYLASAGGQLGRGAPGSEGDCALHLWRLPALDEQPVLPPSRPPQLWPGELRRMTGHPNRADDVAFSSCGRLLLSGSFEGVGSNDSFGSARLWDVATGQLLRELVGHQRGIRTVALSPDGQFAATSGHDDLWLWEAATGKPIRSFHLGIDGGGALRFLDGGRRLALTHPKRGVLVWETATGKQALSLASPPDSSTLTRAALTPDGRLALYAGPKRIVIWDVAKNQAIGNLEVQAAKINTLAASPDGRLALAGGEKAFLGLWDVAAGAPVTAVPKPAADVRSAAFSADGRHAAIGLAGDTIIVWEIATGKESIRFQGAGETNWLLAFSPDGKYLLSAGGRRATFDRSWHDADYDLHLWQLPEAVQHEQAPPNNGPAKEPPAS